MKKLLTACFFMGITVLSYGQLRVFYNEKDDAIGYYAGGDLVERYQKAQQLCQSVKNSYCLEIPPVTQALGQEHNQYGCWAIVFAKDKDGKKLVTYDHFRSTPEEAVKNCTNILVAHKGALANSITVYRSGCEKNPAEAVKPAETPKPEWSEWKQAPCYAGLQYRVKSYEVFDLNRQYHYYFEVRNNYRRDISFVFNLLDAEGKTRFGNRYDVRNSQTVSFNHKMTSNYISSFQVQGMRAALSNEDIPCDDAAGSSNSTDWQKDAMGMVMFSFEIKKTLTKTESQERSNQLMNLRAQMRIEEKRFQAKYFNRQDISNESLQQFIEQEVERLSQRQAGSSGSKPVTATKPTDAPSAKLPIFTMQTSFEEDLKMFCDLYCLVGALLKEEKSQQSRSRAQGIDNHMQTQLPILEKKYPTGTAKEKQIEAAIKAETKRRGCPEIQ
jgi:hypothetical protein